MSDVMNTFMNFKFKMEKNHVLNVVNSYYKIDDFDSAGKIYDNLTGLLQNTVAPVGLYKMEKKPEIYNFEPVGNCRYVVFCLITLGSEITEMIDELFGKGEFLEGIILDAMASTLLFEYNSQFYSHIYEWASGLNMGITCRIAPGDGEIPFEYQEDIVRRISIAKEYGITIIKGYVLNPAKSMSYIHGADEHIEKIKRAHDCKSCSSMNCFMREAKERIRKPFKAYLLNAI